MSDTAERGAKGKSWRGWATGIAAGALAVAALVAALWMRGEARRGPTVIRPAVEAPVGADPLASLPETDRQRLTRPGLDRPATFKRVFMGRPEALCAELTGIGVPMSDWRPDPLVPGAWFCASDLVAIGAPGADGRSSSLFVNLRGLDKEGLGSVRIKLNGDNPRTAPQAQAALLRVLEAVGARYGWPLPDALRWAVERGQPLRLVEHGVDIKVLPEDPRLIDDAVDVRRLNVILDFPTVDLLAPAELFAPFAWERDRRQRGPRPQVAPFAVPAPDAPDTQAPVTEAE